MKRCFNSASRFIAFVLTVEPLTSRLFSSEVVDLTTHIDAALL